MDLFAIDLSIPAATSPVEMFWARRLTISDSAKTVHILDILTGSYPLANVSILSISLPKRLEVISKNRPVPAAHLSFIIKLNTFPSLSKFITLLSWPPTSKIVLMLLFKK